MVLHEYHVATVGILVVYLGEPLLQCILNPFEVRIRDAYVAVDLNVAYKTHVCVSQKTILRTLRKALLTACKLFAFF